MEEIGRHRIWIKKKILGIGCVSKRGYISDPHGRRLKKKVYIQRPSPDLPNQFLRIKTRIYDSIVPESMILIYEIAYGNHLIGKILWLWNSWLLLESFWFNVINKNSNENNQNCIRFLPNSIMPSVKTYIIFFILLLFQAESTLQAYWMALPKFPSTLNINSTPISNET